MAVAGRLKAGVRPGKGKMRCAPLLLGSTLVPLEGTIAWRALPRESRLGGHYNHDHDLTDMTGMI